ncbi:MAG: hypothetical protein FJW30_20615 [Acidobacteria bacterium]|nr:hypothetical protein [Acidobacteriota bacterium]
MPIKVVLAVLLAARCWPNGFDYFYNLEYERAIVEFEKEIVARPSDPAGYNHLAQAILYREMLRAGSLESELVTGSNPFLSRAKILPPAAEQRRFDGAIEQVFRLCEGKTDTESLYLLGIAHGLRANYNFLIRKLWRDALKEFTQARRLHAQVVAREPARVDAYLVEGVHDYIVGSLPFTWKLLGFLVGFRGDKDGGLRVVERVAREGDKNRVDAIILLTVAYRREREAAKAVPLLRNLMAQYPRNYLLGLVLVQMYGDLGRKDEALTVLSSMKTAPEAKVRYSRGNLLFWFREYDSALKELDLAVRGGEAAGLNTIANSWLRKGQCHDMLSQRDAARAAYRASMASAPDSDAAGEARKYFDRPYARAK